LLVIPGEGRRKWGLDDADRQTQGLVNIWWIPVANIIGRRFVFLVTTILCCMAGVGLGSFHGVGAYMGVQVLNGLGTSAYQAVIQLAVSQRAYNTISHDGLD